VSTTRIPPKLPPRQKAGILNAIPDPQASKTDKTQPEVTEPSESATQTGTPRFVAPPPTTAAVNSSLSGAFRTLLEIFPSQRQDTAEEALIRRQLEEEQIARYMNSFIKHVQYLRIDPESVVKQETRKGDGTDAIEPKKPSVEEFRAAPSPAVSGDQPTPNLETTETAGVKGKDVALDGQDHAVDWFGYYAAVSVPIAALSECLPIIVLTARRVLHSHIPPSSTVA
jgi:hypothetical protein